MKRNVISIVLKKLVLKIIMTLFSGLFLFFGEIKFYCDAIRLETFAKAG
jgi:hypothetical protein